MLASVLFVFNAAANTQSVTQDGITVNATLLQEGFQAQIRVDFSGSSWDIDRDTGPYVTIDPGLEPGGATVGTGPGGYSCGNAYDKAAVDVCMDGRGARSWDPDAMLLEFNLEPHFDTVVEGDETFTIEFEGERQGESSTFTFTLRDAMMITVVPGGGGHVDEGEDAIFKVTANPPPVNATVWLTVDESPGTNFVMPGRAQAFVRGSGTGTLSIPTTDDGTFGPDGRVHMRIPPFVPGSGSHPYVVGDPSVATVVVHDNDRGEEPDGPIVGVSALATSVFEGDDAAFAVTAVPAPKSPLTVSLTVADASGSDFINSSQQGQRNVTVTVPSDGTEPGYAEVAIPTVNDRARETSGDITVMVNEGSDYAVTPYTGVSKPRAPRSSATIRVNDDDGALPVVTIAGGDAVNEGSEAVFTLTANPAPAELTELIVNMTVRDVSGSDFLTVGYEGKGRKAVIPAGASTVTWRLPTVDDTTGEASGEVHVFLGAGRGYRVGSAASASVQVDDDDGLPSMDSEYQPSTLQIVRDSELEALIQARIDLTASRGDQHSNRIWRRALAAVQGASPPLGLQPLTAPLAQKLADNHARNGNAELSELWQRIAHVLLGATVQPQQSEQPVVLPVVTITAGPTVSEGDPARFTLRASPAPKSDLTVTLAVSEKGSLGDHVAASDEGWVHATISAGSTQTVFRVATVDDREHESDGPVSVAVGSGAGYTASPVEFAQVTITDDDAYPIISVSAGGSVVEGGTATFTISADLAPIEAITIHYELSQSGKVLTTGGTSIRSALLSAGQTSLTVDVPTLDDAHFNADRWLKLSLRGSLSYPYRLGTPESATVTVTNDDAKIALPTLSISNGHAGESSRLITFTVTLSATSERPVEVFVRTRETSPASARAWQDFIPRSSQLVRFAPGETSQRVSTFLFDDNVTEGTERFQVQLYRAKGAKIAKSVATGTIVD